jgi:hypothetical protein
MLPSYFHTILGVTGTL